MTLEQVQATTQRETPDRAALRAELERTRREFHDLLASTPECEWKQERGNESWNVGQLLYHIAYTVGFTADGVQRSRQGKGFNPPSFLTNLLNEWSTKWGARTATRESIGRRYDDAHAKIVAALDTVKEDEWQKGATFFGRFLTVEGQFCSVAEHFKEHAPQIRRTG